MCVSMRVVYCWLVPTLSHTCYQRAKWYVDMSVAGWGMLAADYTAGSPRAAVASHIGGNCAGDQVEDARMYRLLDSAFALPGLPSWKENQE